MPSRLKRKEESREKILKAAASLFRKNGFSLTGIDALMEKAGLTAGAFYAHFDSKEQLLEEALKYALDQSFAFLTAGLADLTPEQRTKALLKIYLSPEHRDLPQKGCPIASLAAELGRQNDRIRKIVADYIERLTGFVAEGLPRIPAERRRAEALSLLTGAVGALLLSRMTKGFSLSEELIHLRRD